MALDQRLHVCAPSLCYGLNLGHDSTSSRDENSFAFVFYCVKKLSEVPRCLGGANFRHEIMIIR